MDKFSKSVGRFAPTPSGRLHLGNIAAAMMGWLSAKSRGGDFLLRIEDLDTARCPQSAVDEMLDDLEWFGFTWDGEVLYQSRRAAVYDAALSRLEPLLYPCYCSRTQLHAASAPHGDTPIYDGRCRHLDKAHAPRRPYALRIRVPDETVEFSDGVFGEKKQNLLHECGDFIVRRSDGVHAYQLAMTVDDGESGVTEIVRGGDLVNSAPRQIYLFRLLGYSVPTFSHIPLLLDHDGERMSKRNGRSNLGYIRENFSRPESIIGAIARSYGLIDKFRPLSLQELLPEFSLGKTGKENVAFDPCGLW